METKQERAEHRAVLDERFKWVREMSVGIPNIWLYSLLQGRLEDEIIDDMVAKLSPYVIHSLVVNLDPYSVISSPDYEFQRIHSQCLGHFSIQRTKSLETSHPDHLRLNFEIGSHMAKNPILLINPVDEKLIEFVRSQISVDKTALINDQWDEKLRIYECDRSSYEHRFLRFGLALELWYKARFQSVITRFV